MNKICGSTCAVAAALAVALWGGVGCKRPGAGEAAAPGTGASTVAVPAGDPARVKVTVSAEGYQPNAVSAPAGKPLTLIFRRISEVGCGSEVVFPAFNIKRALPLNEDVAITITPQGTESIQFTCGMGMYKGTVVVRST